jgi:hypothetical protein
MRLVREEAGLDPPVQLPRNRAELVEYQFRAYAARGAFTAFAPYESQVGGQGIMFAALDRAMSLSPRSTLRRRSRPV